MLYEKSVLKYLAKVIEKHLCHSPFFNNVASSSLQLYSKNILAKMLLCEFSEVFKKIFFTENLRVTASDILMQVVVTYNLNLSLQFVTINLFSSASFHAGA